jgi:hypothetical protein
MQAGEFYPGAAFRVFTSQENLAGSQRNAPASKIKSIWPRIYAN